MKYLILSVILTACAPPPNENRQIECEYLLRELKMSPDLNDKKIRCENVIVVEENN